MCLPIDSCFGFGTPHTDDDRYHAPAATKHGAQRGGHHYNGGYYYNGNSYPVPAHGAVAGGEADRTEASTDFNVRRGGGTAAHAVPMAAGAGAAAATRGWHGHGHAATVAQEKEKQADGTLKPQHDKVVAAADGARGVGGAPHGYYYYEREQQPAHKEDAADSYYPAVHHESPSEALGEK